MKNFKQIICFVLVLVLVAAASIGITVAYLTDRDSKANVFTIGDVSIKLNESFKDGATLIPGVKIEKKPTIENTGINDAWVWATVAIPSALDAANDASKNIVHFNFSKESVADGLWTWTDAQGNWLVEENVDIKGIAYNVYTVLYQTPLARGEETAEPVITQVYLDTHMDIDPEGNMCWVENGTPSTPVWNVKENAYPVMYVSAYAVQKETFNTVQEAYAAYQAQWGSNGTEYDGTPVVDNADALAGVFNDNATDNVFELNGDAIVVDLGLYQSYDATETVTIDGNGNTVTLVATEVVGWGDGTKPANGIVFGSDSGEKVTVSNLTITGDSQAIMAGYYAGGNSDWFNTEFNNVHIVDIEATGSAVYVCHALSVYGTVTMNNSTVTGTTISPLYSEDPAADGLYLCDVLVVNNAKLIANDSTFGVINGGQQGTRHYYGKSYIELNNSTADKILACGRTNGGATVINAGSKVGEIVATNYAIVLKIAEGAEVDTLDLTNITNLSKCTFEINGTVNRIVDNGVEYATFADWAAAQ